MKLNGLEVIDIVLKKIGSWGSLSVLLMRLLKYIYIYVCDKIDSIRSGI